MSPPALSRRHLLAAGLVAGAAGAVRAQTAPVPLVLPPPVIARTRAGAVEGVEEGSVRRFLGIPYARPPVGPLRFRPPEPVQPWRGVRPALIAGPDAIQTIARLAPRPVSEDCLYLNLWAPAAPGPHPVLVWVHGGANTGGSPSDPLFDGSHFARAGIVSVNVGYRLGLWGFADLLSIGATNNALRDIALALAWVRDNIAGFGGDPGRVTLMGQSAGAKNVVALLASPRIAGVYHQAIIQSGGGQTVHGRDGERDLCARIRRALLAAAGGRPPALDRVPAAALLAAQTRVIASFGRAYPFRSTIGDDLLPGRPLDLIAVGGAARVPMIVGHNRDESLIFMGFGRSALPVAPREIANVSIETMREMESRYAARYPDWEPLARRLRALSAEEYGVPTMRLAEAQARAGVAPVFLYRYDHPAPSGPYAGYAVHGAELPHVFAPAAAPAPPLHAHWANFVRTGRPAIEGAPDWPGYHPERPLLMRYAADLTETAPPDFGELALWQGRL